VRTKPTDPSDDEAAGFEAFPAGRYRDARRGTKSYPDDVRCPYRAPARVAAWTKGYNAALAALDAELG
jgi:hypothetical protein